MTVLDLNVSRETLDRLSCFHDLLTKWNPKINLVSKASLAEVWDRHIRDSAQMYPLADTCRNWVDMGSGGGLPGLVITIIARELNPDLHVTMIESDMRKATFLRTVIRELGLTATVLTSRIEQTDPLDADVLSARALADLSSLLSFADHHLNPNGHALFFKGETWQKEVDEARKAWSFDLVSHTSKTNPNAAILEVREIKRV
ncbi:16S rRNA (guanine(527)-N(7))-methyltransferase RsmG [uncultured Roseobacter sp.]|uniref:16S rRNA (guanine(527)-N(7))-methyltransferase RsmG n=1 Tax=uncultured Roseobacter sp. TaxID=114847 RepID=UPI00260488B2|nr:16S rRNA (guanine(527)-N(7))-methyltransferase RsmG [uncultured Roseobacter sp.]